MRFLLCLLFLITLSPSIFADNRSAVQKAYDIIHYRYVDPRVNMKAVSEAGVRGMVEALPDENSRYISPERFQKMLKKLAGNVVDIGLDLGIREGKIVVISSYPGSPSQGAGLLPLDQIDAIDGASTDGLSVDEAQSYLFGSPGSYVNLSVYRLGYPKLLQMRVRRKAFDSDEVSEPLVFHDRIGYLRVFSFFSPTVPKLVKDRLKVFQRQGVDSVIIDMRGNGGGLLNSAVEVAGYFIPNGTVCFVMGRSGSKTPKKVSRSAFFTTPKVVVLVDDGTASAAEIFAAAISENERGIVMGTQTFGKASIQRLFQLPDKSAMSITVGQYLTAGGEKIDGVGIVPDQVIRLPRSVREEMRNSFFVYSFDKDYMLQEAIDYLLR